MKTHFLAIVVLVALVTPLAAQDVTPTPFLFTSVYYYNQGVQEAEGNDHESAVESFTRAIQLTPSFFGAYNGRGLAYLALGEYDLAVADFNRAIGLGGPELAVAYHNRGYAYSNLGNYEKALTDFEQAIVIDPDDAEAYYGRGSIYHTFRRYDEAIADYTHAIELDPDFGWAYHARGLIYEALGQNEQALADYNLAIEADHFGRAYASRGDLYIKLREYEQALADFTRAIELSPEWVFPYLRRTLVYIRQEQYQEAIADLTRLIQLAPEEADYSFTRGLVYFLLDEYQQSIVDYTRAMELDPDHTALYYWRAMDFAGQGDLEQTIADLREYVRLVGDGASSSATSWLAQLESGPMPHSSTVAYSYYHRGLALRNLGDSENALINLNAALDLDPDNIAMLRLRGYAYRDVEDYVHAVADLTRVIELDPSHVSLVLIRGNIYAQMGDTENAARDYYRWLTLNEQRTFDQDTLTPSEPFTVQMQEGALFNVPFEAEAGQVVSITANDADNSGVDPLIVILDADGNALTGDDDSGGESDSLITDFEIPADGTYTLVIGHAGGGSVGAVEVTLEIR